VATMQRQATSKQHLGGGEGLAASAAAAGAPSAGPLALVHLPEAAFAEPLIEQDLVRRPASYLYLRHEEDLVNKGDRPPMLFAVVFQSLRRTSLAMQPDAIWMLLESEAISAPI